MTAFYAYMSAFENVFYHADCLEDSEINPKALSPEEIFHKFVKLRLDETTNETTCTHCQGPLGVGGLKASLEIVKIHRNMLWLEYGMRMEFDGKPAIVRGGNSSANLDVEIYGQDWLSNVHPWWQTVYYDKDDKIIADYREVKR